MAEDTPTPQLPPSEPVELPVAQPAPVQPLRRHRWRWILGIFLLAVALLVLGTPTLLSTGPARSYVLSRINQELNGTAEADDWSIGWTSGIDIRGLRLKDAQGRLIFDCAHASTSLTLLDALRGRYDLGKTNLDEPNFVIFDLRADGSNNLQELFKNSPRGSNHDGGHGGGASPLPHFSGDIQANRTRATVTLHDRAGQTQTVILDPSTVKFDLTGLDGPIHHDLSLHLRTSSSTSGELLLLQGTAGLNGSGQLQLDDLLTLQLPDAAAPAARFKLHGVFTGGVPLGQPFEQAIQSLAAEGNVGIDLLDFDGLHIEKANIPLQLSKGILSMNGVTPIACNDGQIDLTGLQVLLGETHPRLNLPPHTPLAHGIVLNTIMADTLLGKYASPVFLHPDQARGLLNVTVNACQRLPLDDLISSPAAENDGQADVTFSIEQASIVGGALAQLRRRANLPNIPKAIEGSIPDARMTIEHGQISQTLPLQLGKLPPLRFDGLLMLSKMSYDYLNMEVSPDLLRQIDKGLAQALPNGWTFVYHGPANALKAVKGTGPEDLLKTLLLGPDISDNKDRQK